MPKKYEAPETIMHEFDGEEYECTVEVDHNGEYVVMAPNGRFIKYPSNHKF